jgi:hypothetical protein
MFRDRVFDEQSLILVESARVFGHACARLEFQDGIRRLASPPVLDPASRIARQSCSVGRPCQKIGEWLRHRRFAFAARVFPATNAHGWCGPLAGAAGWYWYAPLAGAASWYAPLAGAAGWYTPLAGAAGWYGPAAMPTTVASGIRSRRMQRSPPI